MSEPDDEIVGPTRTCSFVAGVLFVLNEVADAIAEGRDLHAIEMIVAEK